ncbi:MAG: divergent polysaccharide deacetylase family protein, partial [Desulfobacteraceae bacterium]|nr:divergent polysaccharide deacetylase family protein [Desulfobacteraceae bacterium]
TASSKKSTSGSPASQKTGTTRSRKSTESRKKGRERSVKWEFLVFAGILAAVVLLAGYYHLYFKPPKKPPEPVSVPEKPRPPELPEKRPLVAIIIDDLGHEKEIAEKFLGLGVPFTYAVLPASPFQKEIAEQAYQNGGQVILHLPMEPKEYPDKDPGPGALLSEMSADERIRILKKNLDAIPYISGINNHMGSKMSENSAHMNQILSIVKKRGLYYIDSLTTPNSRSISSARLFHVPFAERDVFIDHVPEAEFIRFQLERLVEVAREKGRAIGIAHPHEVTYEVLAEKLPGLKQQVRLVPASEVTSIRKS